MEIRVRKTIIKNVEEVEIFRDNYGSLIGVTLLKNETPHLFGLGAEFDEIEPLDPSDAAMIAYG